LASISPPPTVQSSEFFRLPGSVPAYSGVQNKIASADAIRARSVTQDSPPGGQHLAGDLGEPLGGRHHGGDLV
jgi:hypothetical protein